MRERFKVNDYVIYDGDKRVSELCKRNKDYARIIDIKIDNGKYWFNLELVSIDEKIFCPLRLLTEIETNKIHLINLGFSQEVFSKNSFYYKKNNIIISELNCILPTSNFYEESLLSGFCLADFRSITCQDIEKYCINGKFDQDRFKIDFPSLVFVNDLFDVLEGMEKISIDRKKIISSIKLV